MIIFRKLVLSKYYYINWLPFWTPYICTPSAYARLKVSHSVKLGIPEQFLRDCEAIPMLFGRRPWIAPDKKVKKSTPT